MNELYPVGGIFSLSHARTVQSQQSAYARILHSNDQVMKLNEIASSDHSDMQSFQLAQASKCYQNNQKYTQLCQDPGGECQGKVPRDWYSYVAKYLHSSLDPSQLIVSSIARLSRQCKEPQDHDE